MYFRKYADQQAALGLQLAKIGKIQLHLNELDNAKQILVEANKHLKFRYGTNHPVYDRFKVTLRQLKAELESA